MSSGTIYKTEEGKKSITRHYDEYLHSFAFDVERLYINTRFGKTHLLACGPKEGKPLFILQGGNCINPMTLSWFLPIIDHYRVYAPDTIGHPGYSDETRLSAKDDSFAQWIGELMDALSIDSGAFIGPSYGAGIILNLASYGPNRIDCAILVSPSGIKLGSTMKMVKDILFPMMLFNMTDQKKHLNKLTGNMSAGSMKDVDRDIIGDVFRHVKLERDMPKLAKKTDLLRYKAPTLVIAGEKDIFFPAKRIKSTAEDIIPNLVGFKATDMGHFPSEPFLKEINSEIEKFLKQYY